MTRIKALATLILTTLLCMPAMAEDNGVVSPYSRYGLGQMRSRATGWNSSMGGVGIGTQNGGEVNTLNPASYAGIDSLSFIFDVGATVKQSSLKSGSTRINTTTAALDYITTGFRAGKHLGVSLGLLPLSNVGYSTTKPKTITDSYNHSAGITATSTAKGSGGLHEIYLGMGYAPVRHLALGVSAGYIWGSIDHDIATSYSDATMSSSSRSYRASLHTYNLQAGVQGYIPMGRRDRLTLGVSYTLGHKVANTAYMVTGPDSVAAHDAFEFPHSIGAGLSWEHRGRLRLSADYELQKWGQCRYPWATNSAAEPYKAMQGYLRDSHRIAVGMEFRPMKKGSNWREYVSYRCGVSVTTPYANVPTQTGSSVMGKGPTTYLATAGVNLPVMNIFNARSSVNVAVQYERVQPAYAGQLKENNLLLCVGINFNEQWFTKWKVN